MREQGFISLIKHIPGLNYDYAVESIGGSVSLYEKTLMKVVRRIPRNIEKMELFLSGNVDLDEFTVIVHGVKGSLSQVGCFGLARRAELLENAARNGDGPYCGRHYSLFREELLQFYNRMNEAVPQSVGPKLAQDSQDMQAYGLNDFFDTLVSVKTALEGFDSMTAAELFLPLTERSFGRDTDTLISKIAAELESFRPRSALDYIFELMNICEAPDGRPDKEE